MGTKREGFSDTIDCSASSLWFYPSADAIDELLEPLRMVCAISP